MIIDRTTLATEIVTQAWFAMLNDIRETGAHIIEAIEGGALERSRIHVKKEGADVAKIEEAMFNYLLFVPVSLEDEGDHWLIVGSQKWSPRIAEPYTKEEEKSEWRTRPAWRYHLPSVTSYIG